MDPKAVIQAGERLDKANRAVKELHAATDFISADAAWTDLLTEAQTIFAKLEQGSKASGKSQAWFGKKKAEQRNDPLLRYIKFARNSEEHGLDRSTIRDMGSSLLGRPMAFGERVPIEVAKMNEITKQPEGPWDKAGVIGPELRLTTAYDRRFGDSCEPPATHLGQDIKWAGQYAKDVADLTVLYFEALLIEAANLVEHC